ncbi:hypothetical protein HLB44_01765 [Aquincola sp. S2]|uniref:Uncharacterized protein n=1 Tax=Pseudaquabacterium terrae TaxID=2732868 RepID=A0ABX2EAY6_9BURK|nr:hypothetical protein [Aquabacterium terrae]NRF65703.1 hypothetical protein [Aquabacterium terrae]
MNLNLPLPRTLLGTLERMLERRTARELLARNARLEATVVEHAAELARRERPA